MRTTNDKENTMRTTKTNANNAAIKAALGGRRIDRVSWKTLARVYAAASAT